MNLHSGLIALAVASAAAFFGSACAHNRSESASASSAQPDIHIEASNRDVVVGDTVTISTRIENAYGRDASIKWRTTGGTLSTENSDTIAHVTFKKTGTYTVTARVSVKDRESREDSVDIRVRAAN